MKNIRRGILSFVLLVILWQVIVSVNHINPSLFPGPLNVIDAFKELVTTGLKASTSHLPLISHISISLIRFFIGYLLAVFFGVSIGLILGSYPHLFSYVNPILQVLRPVAPVAWMPFIVLWFGIGNIPAVVIIFIAGFFPILLSTASAIINLDEIYHKVALNFGIKKSVYMIKIALPGALNQIMTSLRLALGTSWIFLVSGEMIGCQSGLGFLLMDSKNCLRPDALFAVIIVIGVLGLLLDTLIKQIEGEVICK